MPELVLPCEVAPLPAEAKRLIAPWEGPYGGVPPLADLNPQHYPRAAQVALNETLAEIDALAEMPAVPTFENTIVPLQTLGLSFDRLQRLFDIHTSANNTLEMQAIEPVINALAVQAADALTQNSKLFARIDALYQRRSALGLNDEELRLLEYYHQDFVSAGAALDPLSKAQLSVLNGELADLTTLFAQNLLNAEDGEWVELQEEADFAGLPLSLQATYRAAAQERELPAAGAVFNTRSAVEPFLEYSSRRDLRHRVWAAFVSRGTRGDQYDNNSLITQILSRREASARLCGEPTFAHWALKTTMAQTPEAALALMDTFWSKALTQAEVELKELQALCDAETQARAEPPFALAPWDFRFYAEKLRKAKYDIDAEELRPYLQLEELLKGLAWLANTLFCLTLKELPQGTVPVPHADVRVYEVTRGADHVGLWYFDLFARKFKSSGAWMSEYRTQQHLDGATAIVSNNCNFSKGLPGETTLISWDDARTLFHEFGHGLHGLLSRVTYPSLAGVQVSMDFVELPSQLFENWLGTTEFLSRFARHVDSQAPMPSTLIAKIQASEQFLQGCLSVEAIASAFLDMRMHLAGSAVTDVAAFEREVLVQLKFPVGLCVRHRAAHFGHLFSSDDYAASYYSYLWADILVADVWEAFVQVGVLNPQFAEALRREVLSVGNSRNPTMSFRALIGRDPDVSALMRARGFAP